MKKTKKILAVVLATLSIVTTALGISSCDVLNSFLSNTSHKHSYSKSVVSPTCTEKGYTLHSCDSCEDSYKSDYVDAKGHTYMGKKCHVCGDRLPNEDLEFTLNADGVSYSVTGMGSCEDTDIVIPSTYKGLPVTEIGDAAFRQCDSLTTVVLGNNITSIGSNAFYQCPNLVSVVIGDNVTEINVFAFSFCSSLISVVIPDSVTKIDITAFSSCDSLTKVVIGKGLTKINVPAFHNCDSLTSITVSAENENYQSLDGNLYTKDGKTLIQYAIGKAATSFTIPDGVTSISDFAFCSCTNLTSIVIPDSVTMVGARAFSVCTNLMRVYYKGTSNDWNNISFSAFLGGTPDLNNIPRYYYSETQPTEEGNYWHYDKNGKVVVW